MGPLSDIDYCLDICKRAFGIQLNPKKYIDELNVLYGQYEMRGSNIMYTNGVNDGWKWASLKEVTYENSSIFAHVVKCDNCAHGVDLYPEKDDDAEDLKATRREIRKHVAT